MWYVLSSKVSDDKFSVALKENNVFKMGRIPFRVVQVKALEISIIFPNLVQTAKFSL